MWSSRRPASERAVTAVSSRRGWRCTRWAASAPANPDAPTTATLCTEPPPDRAQVVLDRRTQRGHVGVRERAVRRAEREPQRERLLAAAHLLAAVDVEQPRLGQELAAAGPDRALDLDRRDLLGHDDRDVLEDGRERRH